MQVLQCLLFCCTHSHSHEFPPSLVLFGVFFAASLSVSHSPFSPESEKTLLCREFLPL